MAQLFKRRANSIARAVVFGVPLFAAASCYAWYLLTWSDYATGVDQPVDQPVPFSHKHHVGDDGIDCRYCHTTVENSAFANVPPTETCMTCHSQLYKDAPVLQPVRDSWQTGAPIKWNRVHDLPDYVYFNHSIHVAKGVGCQTCHGQVNEMPLTFKTQSLYMRWCLECHRYPERHLRPTDQVENMNYRPPANQIALGQQLVRQNDVHKNGLTDCYTCHR